MDNIRALLKKIKRKNKNASASAMSRNKENFAGRVTKALDNGEFDVYYQPQYNYNTKKLCGVEALIRWECPTNGMISPAVFIPQLEKSGMIYEVDKCIWQKVCRDLKEWIDSGMNVHHVSVNISRSDIYQDDFEEYIVSLIKEHDLRPENLHLEITETSYVKDLKFMMTVIQSLQKKGFVVEMDDFGSGYSSLKTLKNIPFDIIKLDMEFLHESETNEKAKNILTSIIDMLQKIKVPVIVEGVECEEQARLLNRLGCNYMQGYYFGRPAKKEDFEIVLKDF